MQQITKLSIYFITLLPAIALSNNVCEVIDGRIVCDGSLNNKNEVKRYLTKPKNSIQVVPSRKNPLVVEEFSLKRNENSGSIKIIDGKVFKCNVLENLKEVCKEDLTSYKSEKSNEN